MLLSVFSFLAVRQAAPSVGRSIACHEDKRIDIPSTAFLCPVCWSPKYFILTVALFVHSSGALRRVLSYELSGMEWKVSCAIGGVSETYLVLLLCGRLR